MNFPADIKINVMMIVLNKTLESQHLVYVDMAIAIVGLLPLNVIVLYE